MWNLFLECSRVDFRSGWLLLARLPFFLKLKKGTDMDGNGDAVGHVFNISGDCDQMDAEYDED